MRKILFAISLIAALTFALAVSAAAPTNFAGTWNLDKAKSQGLSTFMQSADSVSWVITQTDKQISIETKITGGQPPAGAPPAGAPPGSGGGMGGGRGAGMGGPQIYNLDGNEATSEMGTSKVTRKATWSSDQKTLELWAKTTRTGQDGTERTSTSTDKLQLSGDGKVLTVNRHSEGGRNGTQDSTLVFNK
jgi:hypothetical protein